MPDIAVKVVVDDTHLESLDAVIRACKQCGLVVERVFEEIGTIFGRAPEEALPALSRTEGVESVGREGTIRIPPISDDMRS